MARQPRRSSRSCETGPSRSAMLRRVRPGHALHGLRGRACRPVAGLARRRPSWTRRRSGIVGAGRPADLADRRSASRTGDPGRARRSRSPTSGSTPCSRSRRIAGCPSCSSPLSSSSSGCCPPCTRSRRKVWVRVDPTATEVAAAGRGVRAPAQAAVRGGVRRARRGAHAGGGRRRVRRRGTGEGGHPMTDAGVGAALERRVQRGALLLPRGDGRVLRATWRSSATRSGGVARAVGVRGPRRPTSSRS